MKKWETAKKACLHNTELVLQLPVQLITTGDFGDDDIKHPPEEGANEAKIIDPEQLDNKEMDFGANYLIVGQAKRPPTPSKYKNDEKTKEIENEKRAYPFYCL